MTDLYDILGVERTADPAAIHKAYRQKSKAAHPDGGGSPEQFAVVKLAHDCLSDAERRKHYDETGEAGETPIDNSEAQALNIVMGAVGQILDTIDQRGADPGSYDVIGDAVRTLKTRVSASQDQINRLRRNAEKLRKIANRFHAKKDKPNKIAAMLEANASGQEQQAKIEQAGKKLVELAISILNDHTFDWSAPTVGMSARHDPKNFNPMINVWGA